MRNLTVGDLLAHIANMPTDTLIVGPSGDHAYRTLDVATAQAERTEQGDLIEYFSEEDATDPTNSVLTVLVLS